jgi:hypothetical protein
MDTHRNRAAQVIKAQKSPVQRSRQKQAASVRDDTSFGSAHIGRTVAPRSPARPRSGSGASRLRSQQGKGVDMSDKSPRKTATKKSGKSLKEKRQAKKDKEQTRKEFGR